MHKYVSSIDAQVKKSNAYLIPSPPDQVAGQHGTPQSHTFKGDHES